MSPQQQSCLFLHTIVISTIHVDELTLEGIDDWSGTLSDKSPQMGENSCESMRQKKAQNGNVFHTGTHSSRLRPRSQSTIILWSIYAMTKLFRIIVIKTFSFFAPWRSADGVTERQEKPPAIFTEQMKQPPRVSAATATETHPWMCEFTPLLGFKKPDSRYNVNSLPEGEEGEILGENVIFPILLAPES